MEYKYPVYRPSLSGNEKKYVNECLDSTWISSKGKFIKDFEERFATYIGIKHAASVSNGTVAIHLALLALGIGEGDEVIVPTLTYIASVNAITYTGARAVFVDSLADSWQMDPVQVESKITPKTKAIMAVHLYGQACDVTSLQKICRKYNLYLVEDCAEAIGTKVGDKYAGTFGDISTFSFFGNKTITTGEGGMVVTNDETLHERAMHFKGQGLAKYREYWHDVIGYNYRMTNICAAIGLAQLEQVEKFLSMKRQIAGWYEEFLKGTPVTFHPETSGTYHSYWMCSLLVPTPEDREKLRAALRENAIETRPLFYPVHTMPMYSASFERYKVAEDLGWRGINLPSYPGLTREDVAFICKVIKDYFND